MKYLSIEETCTVSEALASVGCPLDTSSLEQIRLIKNVGIDTIAVHPDGKLWHSCSGKVLFGWHRASKADCKCHSGMYYPINQCLYVVIDVADNQPFLKIVFSA